MVIFKKLSLFLGIFIYILISLNVYILLFIYPSYKFRIISRWTKIFNRFLRLIFKIKIIIEGDTSYLGKSGILIVSNHLGYLDGIVLGSIFAVVYTTKIQVKSWPLFGWMTKVSGTIFIDREKKGKVSDYIQQTARMLKSKVNVLVFPEGTSTNGQRLLPFQSIHFQPPLMAKSVILPISITYTRIDKEEFSLDNRDRVCWYGQMKFYTHLLSVLELSNIEARLVLHPRIDLALPNHDYSRKTISESLHKLMANNYPLCRL